MNGIDYSVIYQPMLDEFQRYVDVMMDEIPVWLPIMLPIVGAMALAFLLLRIFHIIVDSAITEDESDNEIEISSYDLIMDHIEDTYDVYDYDVDMYSSFMEDVEPRRDIDTDEEFDDYESFM